MGAEVMRGFGAVPKRGAEVGGVLLGVIEEGGSGEQVVVRIDDFAPVHCGYKRGPSYLLVDEDGRAFADACGRWSRESGEAVYAVGYYRSNTRESLHFAPEDAEIMNHYFPDPSSVALLIRPNATKASIAGFFVREDGVFPETTPLEFPFRRWDLTGEERPTHRDRRRERIGPELVRPLRRDTYQRQTARMRDSAAGKCSRGGPTTSAIRNFAGFARSDRFDTRQEEASALDVAASLIHVFAVGRGSRVPVCIACGTQGRPAW